MQQDQELLDAVSTTGVEWQRAIGGWRPWRWHRRRHRLPPALSSSASATVVRAAAEETLVATLRHIAHLRAQPSVRRRLSAVAYLEWVETTVSFELERRSAARTPEGKVGLPRSWGEWPGRHGPSGPDG